MTNFNEEENHLYLDLTKNTIINFEHEDIFISSESFSSMESIVPFDLPHSTIKKMIKVDCSREKKGKYFDIDIKCNSDEFVFIVQEFYLKLLNNKDIPLGVLAKNLSPRFQILYHYREGDTYTAIANKQDINYVVNLSLEDMKYLEETLYYKTDDLNSVLSNLKKTQKTFFIVVGKFKDIINNKNDEVGLFRLDLKDGQVLKISEKEQQEKPPILITHGLASSIGKPYYELVAHLKQQYTVYGFEYYTVNQEIDISGGLLTKEVRYLSELYNEVEIPIVAHSMGGLVSRQAIVTSMAPIKHIIMAGTPNNGSNMASLPYVSRFSLMIANFLPIKVKDFRDLMRGKNAGLQDLSNKTKFIDNLNLSDNYYSQKKYFSLAGVMFFNNSDGLVWLNDMVSINNINMPYIREKGWWHINYFKKGKFESQINQAFKYLLS